MLKEGEKLIDKRKGQSSQRKPSGKKKMKIAKLLYFYRTLHVMNWKIRDERMYEHSRVFIKVLEDFERAARYTVVLSESFGFGLLSVSLSCFTFVMNFLPRTRFHCTFIYARRDCTRERKVGWIADHTVHTK